MPDNPIVTRIKAAISDARRELIDLTRRNRLLHVPRTGKRPHCMELRDADVDELFVSLARRNGRVGLAPARDRSDVQVQTFTRKRLPLLSTALARDALDRKLLKYYREARIYEEEQGVNILFLALGFLKWFEDDRAEEPSWAPLILFGRYSSR
jgi:hypothetical protein